MNKMAPAIVHDLATRPNKSRRGMKSVNELNKMMIDAAITSGE
jgi:hypothetical protein